MRLRDSHFRSKAVENTHPSDTKTTETQGENSSDSKDKIEQELENKEDSHKDFQSDVKCDSEDVKFDNDEASVQNDVENCDYETLATNTANISSQVLILSVLTLTLSKEPPENTFEGDQGFAGKDLVIDRPQTRV